MLCLIEHKPEKDPVDECVLLSCSSVTILSFLKIEHYLHCCILTSTEVSIFGEVLFFSVILL